MWNKKNESLFLQEEEKQKQSCLQLMFPSTANDLTAIWEEVHKHSLQASVKNKPTSCLINTQ